MSHELMENALLQFCSVMKIAFGVEDFKLLDDKNYSEYLGKEDITSHERQ